MTENPLTNKKLFKKFWDYTVDADLMGQVFYTPDGMRAAYDRGRDHQLKQVMKWIKEELPNYAYKIEGSTYLDEDFIYKDLKKAMRPTKTQEENS